MLEQLPPDDNAHPYPNAKNAVRFWEGSETGQAESDAFWEDVRHKRPSLADTLAFVNAVLHKTCPPHRKEDARMLAKEMQTQDFRNYVAGKLGMM